MAYDSAIISYTTKTNKVDLVDAAHINAVQAELVIIEGILGTNVKGNRADLKTRLNNALDPDGSILSGTSYPSPGLTSQLFYKTDVTSLYIYDGTWNLVGNALSSLVYHYAAITRVDITNVGEIVPTTLTAAGTLTYRFIANNDNTTTLRTVLNGKYKKLVGVNTVKVWAEIFITANASGDTAQATFQIGALGVLTITTASTDNSPTWFSGTIDVSSLTAGTEYDITIQLGKGAAANANPKARMGSVFMFNS